MKTIFTCYREWWKARKYFKRPKWYFYDYVDTNSYWNKWFGIIPLEWKMKYDEVRFEESPEIFLRVGKNHYWVWKLQAPYKSFYHDYPDDDNYWEGLLSYLYDNFDHNTKTYNRDITKTYKEYVWTRWIYSEEDKKNNDFKDPICKENEYIDRALTNYAKKEILKHNIELHENGLEQIII